MCVDSRFVGHLPSVLATATMLHVVDQIEQSDEGLEYKKQLLGVLKMNKVCVLINAANHSHII